MPHIILTEDQIDAIAEKAADKAIEKLSNKVYREIGKGIVHKMFWIIGAACVGLWAWLKSGGFIK